MDGGAVAAVEAVAAANEELPERTVIELVSQVSVATAQPIIAALKDAKPGTLIEVHIRHNAGGEVAAMFGLVNAIVHTKANVEITIGRFVMSAAATLWLWFWLWPVPHVKALMPLKPAVLMYHRPRQVCGNNGDYFCFAESLKDGDPVKESLLVKIKIFDDLFDALLKRMGWSSLTNAALVLEDVAYQHHLHHLKEAYYGNKDCVFPVFPDQGATHEDVRAE